MKPLGGKPLELLGKLRLERETLGEGVIKVGHYIIEGSMLSSSIISLNGLIYKGNRLVEWEEYDPNVVKKAITDWLGVTNTRDMSMYYEDSDLIHWLDRARKYHRNRIPGLILTTDTGSSLRVIGDDELRGYIKYLRPDAKAEDKFGDIITEYLSIYNGKVCRSFASFPCLYSLLARRCGGQLYKVKVLNVWTDPDSGWVTVEPMDFVEKGKEPLRREILEKLLGGGTGVPELENWYPIGASAGMAEQGTFLYADENLFQHLKTDAVDIHARHSWLVDNDFPDENPSGFINDENYVVVEDDGSKEFYIPLNMSKQEDIRISKVQGPDWVKRGAMPGWAVKQPKFELCGVLDFDNPQDDGVVAYFPESFWKVFLASSGLDTGSTIMQLGCWYAKGCFRAIPDKEYEERFGFPADPNCPIKGVFLKESVKANDIYRDDDRIEGSYLNLRIVEDCHICLKKGCFYYGFPIFRKTCKEDSEHPKCSECGTCLEPKKWVSFLGEDLVCRTTDLESHNPSSKISFQALSRTDIQSEWVMNEFMIPNILQMEEISESLWAQCSETEDEVWLEGNRVPVLKSVRAKILEILNCDPEERRFSTDAIRYIGEGIYLGHPSVLKVIREGLASYIMSNLSSVPLPAIKVGDKEFTYATILVAPGWKLKRGEVRLPACYDPILYNGHITLLRFPVRGAKSDAYTAKVVGRSYGNVAEVNPEDWKNTGGDFDGDIVVIQPVWATGMLKQHTFIPMKNKAKKKLWSITRVVDKLISALHCKKEVGLVDSKVNRILNELACRGEQATPEEASWLATIHQIPLTGVSHAHNERPIPPTVRMRRYDSAKLEDIENPVTTCLTFDISKGRVPYEIAKWALEAGVDLPHPMNSTFNSRFHWLGILQKYATWIIEEYGISEKTKHLRYKVVNHPLYKVLDALSRVNLNHLMYENMPRIDGMYSFTCSQLFEHYKNLVLLELPQIETSLEDLLILITDFGEEYTRRVTAMRFDEYSSESWGEIREFLLKCRKELLLNMQNIIDPRTLTGTLKRSTMDNLKDCCFAFAGCAGDLMRTKISNTFVFHFAFNLMSGKVVEAYQRENHRNECGVDLTVATQVSHMLNKWRSGDM